MTGLALQIDGKWAVLSDDDSVNIENNSPVWGEGNSFSLPFELDIEANRHILGNADQITGQSVYEVLDGKRAVLYTLGIPVYYGKIKMEDEVELSEGKVDVTLVSGNLTFDEMIDGMNCQDVELLDEIVIGERVTEFDAVFYSNKGLPSATIPCYAPQFWMRMENAGASTVNVTNAYPNAPYCNMRICYQVPEENESGDEATLKADCPTSVIKAREEVMNADYGKYVVLGADRPLSSPCFYILYFLDCLMKKMLGYSFDNSGISYIPDMKRLAFCSTKCGYDEVDTGEILNIDGLNKVIKGGMYFGGLYGVGWDYSMRIEAPLKKCVANSKNFPDIDVSEFIDGIKNGFGIRFLFDEKAHSARCVYLKDILKDTEIKGIGAVEIYEVGKLENNIKGFKLTYSGSDDDTSFNYTDWGKDVVLIDSFNTAMNAVAENNKNLYVDTRTGLSYRIKIDKEAKSSSEKNPSLIEVGAYIPVEYGDCSNEECVETVEIGFTPATMNDVRYKSRIDSTRRQSNRGDKVSDDDNNIQTFAFFLDVSMKYPSAPPMIQVAATLPSYDIRWEYTYMDTQRFDEARTDQSQEAIKKIKEEKGGIHRGIKAEKFENNSPIQEYDTGFMLSVMRGPGREAETIDHSKNYDGEENYMYYTVGQDYTFHSDTVDNYARVWDYNGKEEGGIEVENSFSLKLRAEKPNPNAAEGESPFYPLTTSYAQRRGLFDKFYSEYAYFVVNRKIVKMKCRMEMADLLNIDWTKRYKIGEYVGFINKYSYSVSSSGISDVELEMYYI